MTQFVPETKENKKVKNEDFENEEKPRVLSPFCVIVFKPADWIYMWSSLSLEMLEYFALYSLNLQISDKDWKKKNKIKRRPCHCNVEDGLYMVSKCVRGISSRKTGP